MATSYRATRTRGYVLDARYPLLGVLRRPSYLHEVERRIVQLACEPLQFGSDVAMIPHLAPICQRPRIPMRDPCVTIS